MNTSHILALSTTFIIYTILAFAYFGWGNILIKLMGEREKITDSITLLIWIGWAITLFVFQLIHLIFPIKAIISITVFIIGIASTCQTILKQQNNIKKFLNRNKIILVSNFAVLLLVAGWVASRSMLPPSNYDSYLYHFNKIRWINSFSIIPGLGNLHGRLAFNQSFFAYVAALNFYPFFGHGHSIANSFLFILTFAMCLELLQSVFTKPSLIVTTHPFQYLSVIIVLLALGYLSLKSAFSSPTPDLAATLMQFALMLIFGRIIIDWKNNDFNKKVSVVFLAIMATTAVTVKLSNLVFASIIFGITLFFLIKSYANIIFTRILFLTFLIVSIWILQSIILSGAPLYPSTIGYLPLTWAVSIEQVTNQANWVYSWARQPGTHWSNVLGNWNWFRPWLIKLIKNYKVTVVFPITLSFFMYSVALITAYFKNKSQTKYIEWIISAPAIFGLIYWFFTAPTPRFAGAQFFIILICATLLLLSSLQNIFSKRIFLLVTIVFLIISNIHLIYAASQSMYIVKSISLNAWHPIRQIPLETKRTSSGLLIYVPENGDQCGDSPLPCTPYFNSDLELRNPNNMSSGFTTGSK